MKRPCHLDLLFETAETRLSDPETERELRVRLREVGAGDFCGVTAGDPLEGDLATVPWPDEAAPPSLSAATVRAVVADLGGGETRVHALALSFGTEPVTTWEPVPLTVGATVGTCGFASHTFLKRQQDDDALHDVLARYEENDVHDLGCVLRFDDGPVAIAGSGYGDGIYQLWWGRSASGAVVCLAYDFEVLTHGVFDEITLPLPLTKAAIQGAKLGGIRVRIPWLRGSSRPRIDGSALPQDESVYARVRRADGSLRMPQLRVLGPRVVELDLGNFSDGDHLLLRHVHGTAPMPRVK